MTERTWDTGYQPTLSEFKAHVRITMTDASTDTMLELKLKAAIRSAEHYIGQVIATSAFVLRDHFAKSVTLEGPVIEVSSVAVAGSQLSPGDYVLKGNVLLLNVEASETDALVVNYTAGMQSPDPDIKAAILLHASALFMNPVDSVETLPKASSRLLDPYRSWGL